MNNLPSRRAFLQRQAALASLGVAAPWALNLASMSAASAQTAGSDYRALVCVYLAGANDHHNTVVPLDELTHAKYLSIRNAIALPLAGLAETELVPTNPWPDGRRMALHPSLKPLKALFDDGKLALAMNVGTMTGPITLAEYKSGLGARPPRLFAHNDQTATWMSGGLDSPTGWGGRMADLVLSDNGAGGLFTAITTSGGLFLTGSNATAYQVGANGSTQVDRVFGSDASTLAIKRLMQKTSPNLYEDAHAAVARNSIAADVRVRSALSGTFAPQFPKGTLAEQLQVVARMIAARGVLGVKRQVFFVSLGGFDMHDNLITNHVTRLAEVAGAMKAFYDATVSLGVADKVTSFTASDFGRTLSSNGDGSDHGWGSYHFVMGGAVNGKRWVGQLPAMAVNGPNDVGGGRLLPAISVDQYGATLARWLGVSELALPDVFPRIKSYDSSDLDFMKRGTT